jgi:hypothetical protein
MLTLAQRSTWCAALRSGLYKRSAGMLHGKDGSYCALGLGMHVLGLNKFRFLGEDNQNWSIAQMNDMRQIGDYHSYRYTWSQIADWIEANAPVCEDDCAIPTPPWEQSFVPLPAQPTDYLSIIKMFAKQIEEACSP